MPLALSLDAVAGRLARLDPAVAHEDPGRWAYALREAVALARPDVLVVGWDAGFELAALREAADPGGTSAGGVADALYDADRPLRARAAAGALVSQLTTLSGLFPGDRPALWVAVAGPASLAGALGARADEVDEVADLCADQLVDLLGACAEAGAAAVVLREPAPAAGVDVVAARAPIVRALEHQRVALVTLPPEDDDDVALAPASAWLADDDTFAAALSGWRTTVAGGGLVLGDGPVPAQVALERFQA